MKRAWASGLAVVVALTALPVAAGLPDLEQVGVVTTVSESARTFTIEIAPDETRQFYWNDATAFLTRPAPGLKLRVHYEKDGEGKSRALRVGLAEKPGGRR